MQQDVSLKLIHEARNRISNLVNPTPVLDSLYLERILGVKTRLKLENLNLSGAFKIRGASNALLKATPEQLKNGVVAASAGNHAQGVAHTAQKMGIRATIFMPQTTPIVKVEATRSLGADIRLIGDSYDDAYKACVEFQKSNGGLLVHAFMDADVICGQGSVGLELLEQVPDMGMVIVPVGGGGLISGVACALKESNPKIKVIGVQSSAYPAMKLSLDAGYPISVKPGPTIADGIAVKTMQQRNFDLVKKYVDDIVLVDEQQIASAIMNLMEKNHLLAEGAGAAAVAGLLSLEKSEIAKLGNSSAVCIISGGNIDVNLVRRITMQGLIYSGRLLRLKIKVKDTPGRLAMLLSEVAKQGANILDVQHERQFSTAHFSEVDVSLDIETANYDHGIKVVESLKKSGFSTELVK